MRLCVVNLLLPDFLEVNDNRIHATEQMKQVKKLIFSTVQQKKEFDYSVGFTGFKFKEIKKRADVYFTVDGWR